MTARLQFGQAIAYRTSAVVSKVILEVIVELVGHVHVAVDNQFHVVTNAIACGVDTIVV